MKKIAANRNYRMMKESFIGFKAPSPPASQVSWSWDEVVRMAKEHKAELHWVRDNGQLWVHDGESDTSNVKHTRGVCVVTNSAKCPENKIKPPAGSYYETM